MAKLRDIKTLQKFASVHASIHNHFKYRPTHHPTQRLQGRPRRSVLSGISLRREGRVMGIVRRLVLIRLTTPSRFNPS